MASPDVNKNKRVPETAPLTSSLQYSCLQFYETQPSLCPAVRLYWLCFDKDPRLFNTIKS